MSWSSYELHLTDDNGVRITDELGTSVITKALWLQYTLLTNDVGTLRIGLPTSFDTSLIQPDNMIQVWRAPEGGRLALIRPYFIRGWRYETKGSQQFITVSGRDPNDLLTRRIIAYPAAEPQSEKADNADDMMKEIIDENFTINDVSMPYEGSREYTDFTIQPDLTAGPILLKGFAWRNVLTVLQDLAEAARTEGTEVFFRVDVDNVSSSSISFQFRTTTGQPGQDLTNLGVLFDQERGNMQNPFRADDWTEEVNFVYGGGDGQADDRNIQWVSDSTRYNLSKWNRREAFADARNQETDEGVEAAAQARLDLGKPQRTFGADVLDVGGMKYGRDWNWGDKLRARYRRQEFDCIVRAVIVSVDGQGKELIRARLEWEE